MLDSTADPIRQLRDAFGAFASGVTVVTLRDGEGQSTGITVNSFSSLSLDPPLVLFSVGLQQPSCRWFETGDAFNINVLSEGQEDVAWKFARPARDKYEGVGWREGANGLPVIEGALATFKCRKWELMDGGDHRIVVGRVEEFEHGEGAPLLFFRGEMRQIGE